MKTKQPENAVAADFARAFDVLVIGGGNAALCAAMTAREAGATVLMLESSPREFRGGNSRHTRNLRFLHDSANWHLTGYTRYRDFAFHRIKPSGIGAVGFENFVA